jgi:hypothetical protein
MAKTAKIGKGAKRELYLIVPSERPLSNMAHAAASKRSRAARRETSPSIDTDKSLKSAPLPDGDKGFLAVQNDAGITKRKSKGKPLSRNKRMRQEKGFQRAEAVLDQLDKKVETSSKRARNVKERSVRLNLYEQLKVRLIIAQYPWDEVNEKVGEKKRNKSTIANDELSEDVAKVDDIKGTGKLADSVMEVSEPSADAALVPLPVEKEDDELDMVT